MFNVRKSKVTILWALIVVLALYSLNGHRQAQSARRQIEGAIAALLNYDSAAPIEYLFKRSRTEHSKENLTALSKALLERRMKYEALIQLHRPQVNQEIWAAFEQRPNEQATVFFMNLSLKADISEEEWATFDRIAQVWTRYEENFQTDIGHLQVTNPSSLTHQYVTLLQELNELVPLR